MNYAVNPNHYRPRAYMCPGRLRDLCETVAEDVAHTPLATCQIKELHPDTDPSDIEEAVRCLKRAGYIYNAGRAYIRNGCRRHLVTCYEATTRRGW